MGVYIKGMHKAKYCIDCPLMMCNADGDWCALQDAETNESFKSWDDMRKRCPLVEVKAPHGRLIDADVLANWFADSLPCATNDVTAEWKRELLREATLGFIHDLQDAPTVLEAEETDDG